MAEQSQQKTYVLQASDEKKLENIYIANCKTENNNMKFSEFIMLIVEQGIMKNQFGLSFFYEQFQKIMEENTIENKGNQNQQQQLDLKQMKKQAEIEKEMKNPKLTKQKFNQLIISIGLQLYPGQKKPVEKFIREITAELYIKKGQGEMRAMMLDDINKKLILEPSMQSLISFEKDLQMAFTIYITENYERQSIMLSWDELAILNKKMNTNSFLRLLIDANILPQQIDIDSFEDIMMRMLPASNPKEQQFYSSSQVKKMYENIGKKGLNTTVVEGDPCMNFYEMQLFLGRIAFELLSKDNQKKDPQMIIDQFFQEVLFLRKNSETKNLSSIKQGGKPFTDLMARILEQSTGIKREEKKKETEAEEDDPLAILAAAQANQKFFENLQPKVELNTIFSNLIQELPQIPQKYQVKQEVPPPLCFQKPYPNPKIIGVQPPKPPADKTQQKKQETKQNKGGKDQITRPIVWAGFPKPGPQTSYDYLEKYNDQLEFEEPDPNEVAMANMINVQVAPVMLEEILYPKNIPQNAQKYLESAIMYFTEQNFYYAIENLNEAYNTWLQNDEKGELELENQLYFEFFIGQIYLSSGREDMALCQFYLSKNIADKIPRSNPDTAIPYCGMGFVISRMGDHKLSLRCFIKARDKRESAVGGDTCDCANIYNNIGCCMSNLGRKEEAQAYFELAHAIFDLELGPYHTRTLTAKRNLEKIKKFGVEIVPEYKRQWVMYVKDPFARAGKKGGGKKKGKK